MKQTPHGYARVNELRLYVLISCARQVGRITKYSDLPCVQLPIAVSCKYARYDGGEHTQLSK